jgi:hypothetical protein
VDGPSLIVVAPVVGPARVASTQVVTARVRRTAPAVLAGPCILPAPARVALRAPAAVRPLALRARGLAPVLALVDLAPVVRVQEPSRRLLVRLHGPSARPRSNAAAGSSTPRPKKAQ